MQWVRSPGFFHTLKAYLPEGRALPEPAWRSRHRVVLGFVWGHAVGLAAFGLFMGWGIAYSAGAGVLLAAIGLAAVPQRLGRRFRSATAAFGCVTSSAFLVQFSGGYIEAHFHYFIVVALIAIYQDWIPFLLAIAFVALNHGIVGSLAPSWVFNHPAAIANPWAWSMIHAVLVLGQCAVLTVLWRSNEEERARTDLVLTSAGEGILGLDAQGRVTFANRAAEALLGASQQELHGRPVETVLPITSGAAHPLQVVSPQVHAQAAGHLVLELNGARRPLDWATNPITERGRNVGTVVTLMDASQRLRAEDERARRVRQLGELEKMKELDAFKTLFINTAAHELHTPLTPMRLHVYALKEGHKGALSPDQLATVDVLERNVERLSELVEDVLNAARLQANQMLVKKQRVDLSGLVHEPVAAYQETLRLKGLTLEVRLERDLVVEADPARINQVLHNLLSNAAKFTPPGGRILVETTRRNDEAVLRVTDTGIGIRREDIGKLFKPFVQGHNMMQETGVGSGLGLYITQGILELHGGYVECDSKGPGHGATFTVRIPLAGDGD